MHLLSSTLDFISNGKRDEPKLKALKIQSVLKLSRLFCFNEKQFPF